MKINKILVLWEKYSKNYDEEYKEWLKKQDPDELITVYIIERSLINFLDWCVKNKE